VTILPRTRTGGQNGNVRGLFVYVEKSHVISFPLNSSKQNSLLGRGEGRSKILTNTKILRW
jgi:hypothetical protein